jgi:hypothetical protein
MRIYLQSMVEGIPDSMLPQAWVDHDFGFFSHTKRLYDYQQQALRNALKALWKYYWGVESPLTPALSPDKGTSLRFTSRRKTQNFTIYTQHTTPTLHHQRHQPQQQHTRAPTMPVP